MFVLADLVFLIAAPCMLIWGLVELKHKIGRARTRRRDRKRTKRINRRADQELRLRGKTH